MTENEKMTFGATIEARPEPLALTPSKAPSSLRDAPPSPLSATSTPRHEHTDPFDPFYDNNEGAKTATDLKQAQAHTHDLEAQRSLGLTRTESSYPPGSRKKDDSMWPSLKTQKARAKQQKCAKSKNPWAKMGKKQKLIATLVIALFIIGAAVGIGVGVSKAVGGGVAKVGGGTKPIGDNEKGQ
jgi:hypothetical protein